jgi:hypothetical protein
MVLLWVWLLLCDLLRLRLLLLKLGWNPRWLRLLDADGRWWWCCVDRRQLPEA